MTSLSCTICIVVSSHLLFASICDQLISDYLAFNLITSHCFYLASGLRSTFHDLGSFKMLENLLKKHVDAICEQQRRKSACASMPSDQRLCCSLPGWFGISACYIAEDSN